VIAVVNLAKQPSLLRSRDIVNASALIFGASMMLSLGGFVFHMIASRRLGVDGYGVLYAMISLYTLAALPVSLFIPVVTKFSAEFGALHDDGHVRGLIGWIVRASAVLGLAFVIGGAILAVPLAGFFHMAPWEIALVGVMAAVTTISSVMRAIGQGVHAYAAYSWSMAGEGVIKVCAVGVAALAGLTTLGAAGAFLCGMFAGAAFIAVPLVRRYRRVVPLPVLLDWKRIIATTGGAAVLTLTTVAVGFADVLLVKHYFPAKEAGLYSAASLSGKILMYFVGFVPAILIPQATDRHARGDRTRAILWAAIGFVTIVGALGVLAFDAFGWLVLRLLTGGAFDAAQAILPSYAAAMALLALTNCLGSYGIATHRLYFVAPLLVALLATFAAIVLLHPSLAAVVNELVAGNLAMLGATAIPLALQTRGEGRR
jgi:O-antigen/teichoic acid export membrane protein